jgi:TonB family protein
MEPIMESRMAIHRTAMRKILPTGAAAALVLMSATVGLLWSPAAQGAACTPVPVMNTHTLPPYPAVSRQLRESGITSLEITVVRDGHVSGARVTHSSGFPRLDEAASSFVRQNYLWQPMACGLAKIPLKVVWDLGHETP